MRQRRALHRGAVAFTGAAVRPRARHGEQGRSGARAGARGRPGVRGLGVPNFDPRSLPMDAPAEAPEYRLDVGGESVEFGAVSIGNPHAVISVPDIKSAPLGRLGPAIARHKRFPQGTNVGFMQIVDRGHIRLRVFERGVGETLGVRHGCMRRRRGRPAPRTAGGGRERRPARRQSPCRVARFRPARVAERTGDDCF